MFHREGKRNEKDGREHSEMLDRGMRMVRWMYFCLLLQFGRWQATRKWLTGVPNEDWFKMRTSNCRSNKEHDTRSDNGVSRPDDKVTEATIRERERERERVTKWLHD
jgi:hypothetical protein